MKGKRNPDGKNFEKLLKTKNRLKRMGRPTAT